MDEYCTLRVLIEVVMSRKLMFDLIHTYIQTYLFLS